MVHESAAAAAKIVCCVLTFRPQTKKSLPVLGPRC